MFVSDLYECRQTIAGDNTLLREILNPLNDGLPIRYSLAHAIVKPGQTTLAHKLNGSEVYYILEGKGVMYIDDEKQKISPNQAVYIPPDSIQYIKNTGTTDLSFLCIVDPPWREEDEYIID